VLINNAGLGQGSALLVGAGPKSKGDDGDRRPLAESPPRKVKTKFIWAMNPEPSPPVTEWRNSLMIIAAPTGHRKNRIDESRLAESPIGGLQAAFA